MRVICSHLRATWVASVALLIFSVFAQAQAPIIDAGQQAPGRAVKSSANTAGPVGGSAAGELYQQLQQLQQEVADLRGIVEEQGHQIDTLRQQGLDRYNDLDRRLNPNATPAAGPTAAATIDSTGINAGAAPTAPSGGDVAAAGSAAPTAAAGSEPSPDEYEAYKQAYAKLKGQDFTGGIKAFNAFLKNYPTSTLVPNAYYWLGELHLQAPQDLSAAQAAFGHVVNDYPQNNKAPDALYKLGKVYFQQGNKAKAKQLLQQVIDNYGSSGSTAPTLAKQFLDQNFK